MQLVCKILGSFLVIISTYTIGMMLGENILNKLKELELLRRVLIRLRQNIEFNSHDIEYILEDLKISKDFVTSCFIDFVLKELKMNQKNIETIWKEAFENSYNKLFTIDELKKLSDIGSILFNPSINAATESINYYVGYIDELINEYKLEYADKGKLYKALSLTGGVFICVILI